MTLIRPVLSNKTEASQHGWKRSLWFPLVRPLSFIYSVINTVVQYYTYRHELDGRLRSLCLTFFAHVALMLCPFSLTAVFNPTRFVGFKLIFDHFQLCHLPTCLSEPFRWCGGLISCLFAFPLGAAATVGVLVLGLVDLRRNKNPVRNHMCVISQKTWIFSPTECEVHVTQSIPFSRYMRLRVLFQGLTIASLVGYTIKGQLNGTKKKPAIP